MKFYYSFFIKTILVITIAFLIYSCEEIIQVNLREDSTKTVIEGSITNGSGPFSLRISRTQSYFNQTGFTCVDNAEVELSDSQNSDKLIMKGAGIYSTDKIRGVAGKTYYLKISTNGKSYTASTTLPPPVKIDTVYFDKGLISRDSLSAYVQFNDPAGVSNYYRIRVIKNGFYASQDYNLVSDSYTDGQTMLAPIYQRSFAPGDTVMVELLNLDCSTWKYYKGLSEIIQQGVSLQSPGNPPSNISGGALGNFGAWGKSTFKIIVPKLQ